MKVKHRHSALAIMAAAFASAVAPVDPISVSAWAAQEMVVPDGPYAGEKWSLSLGSHCAFLMDVLGPESPVNEVTVMKSAQTGFTTALLAAIGHSIDRDPCRMMVVQPTSGALSDFNKDKLQPMIEATAPLKEKVRGVTSRSADGSTSTSKQFSGGSLTLAIASSAADLRSKTIKKAYLDEIDQYPDDLDDQGDPLDMVEARQIAFLNSGDWKRLKISTPTIKGASKIERDFELGDQRRWHVKCPHCEDGEFVFTFDRRHFKFNDQAPYDAHYVAPCCGSIIHGHEKEGITRRGKFKPTAESKNGSISAHYCAMSSPFVPWDEVARKFAEADGDPQKMKSFTNLYLGLAYEVKGDAPDHERLMERRIKDLKRGVIAPNGVVVVAGCDVQGNGIYYNFRCFAPDGQSWPIDADFIAGETTDPRGGAFLELRKLAQKEWPDSYGGFRRMDMMAVDAGYRSNVVYMFARDLQAVGVVPVAGVDGWFKPAFGIGTTVEINYNNQRIRQGTVRYPVGTWPLKGDFYAALRQKGMDAGAEKDPSGYIHFGGWQDEAYFKQITGEYLTSENYRGRTRRVWKEVAGKENHFLDTEIYLRALFHHLTDRFTAEDWQVLVAERNVPVDVVNPDMFAPAPHLVKGKRNTSETERSDDPAPTESFWD